MEAKNINREYIDLILDNQNKYIQDYRPTLEKVTNSKAQYRGESIPTLYHPYFITGKNVKDFQKIGDMMLSIGNKITERYLEDKEFRNKFGFPKWIEDLIQVDNGYDINVPMGRFDIFYKDAENFMFCELNADGSSAMSEDNEIAKIMLESQGLSDFSEDYNLNYFELFNSWVDKSIEIFHRYDSKNKSPNVAIVDFKESRNDLEFQEFKQSYINKGYNCKIVDPRDVEYRDGKLYHEDYKIDLVYRRLVTFELINKADEISNFIEAYKNKAFCCIGSLRSQVMHNKIFFKILHDKDTLEELSEEERDFVKHHIPYTGIFGKDKEVFNNVLENKDKYIMKPMDLNASQGVYAGKDLTQEEWKERLRESWNNDYLYQEYYNPYEREFLILRDDEFRIESFGSILGLYLYDEELAGIYSRIGQESIIAGVVEYYTLPSILVKG
ncbi:MAG TPA: glutathionylspermidine synthase family protein [Tissierellaceae bacterium]|nr:glutathionylspermidine synthase family protein [Tissierellaceae bacterium]